MNFGGTPEIEDAPTNKGNQIARTAVSRDALIEVDVAVIRWIELRPFDRGDNAHRVKFRRDCAFLMRIVQHEAFAVGQVISPRVAAVVDQIAIETGLHQAAHACGEAHGVVIGGIQAMLGNRYLLRVHRTLLWNGWGDRVSFSRWARQSARAVR